MYKVKEVLDSLALADLIKIVNENKHSEHDCDRETYINHIIANMYRDKFHRVTLLYIYDVVTNSDKAIGYMICRWDNFIMNEFIVVDIYITEYYQGNNCIKLLIDDIIPVLFETGTKRIKWQSGVLDEGFWNKHSFGVEVEKYEMFYVSLVSGTEDTYKKSRKSLKEEVT